ncbi:MAG: S1C family serine protease [Acidimicrobiales bacterium]
MVVTAAVVGSGSAAGVELLPRPGATPTPAQTGLVAPTDSTPGSVRTLLVKTLPAVVSIKTTQTQGLGTGVGAGTGIVVSPGGEVLTNAHVVRGAEAVTVTRYGTTQALPAHLVGASPADDLALLKIEGASGLPTLSLGHSAEVQVGDPVLAVGNALGLADGTPTVTQGIISATGRSLPAEGSQGGTGLSGLFQTDAAINPGNSGGPLVNLKGQVIGVNTASAQGAPGRAPAQNIGFAIPSDHAASLLPDLRRGGVAPAEAAYLGVGTVTLTPSLREAYGLLPERGVLVARVSPGSPAAGSGLAPGDVIVAAGGQDVASAESLGEALRSHRPGDLIHLDLVRGSQSLSLPVTLATQPGQGA